MHQHHLAHSCNLPLFLLTEGIKELTQTAVQMPLFFYAVNGKKKSEQLCQWNTSRWHP